MSDRTKNVPLDASKDGRTQQSFKQLTDINSIVAKAQATGLVTGNVKPPMYLDVSKIPDYQTALNTVIQAENVFNSLSAVVRERFSNNPLNMVNFLMNKGNVDEAIKLGLVEPPKASVEPVIQKVEVVNPGGSMPTGAPQAAK